MRPIPIKNAKIAAMERIGKNKFLFNVFVSPDGTGPGHSHVYEISVWTDAPKVPSTANDILIDVTGCPERWGGVRNQADAEWSGREPALKCHPPVDDMVDNDTLYGSGLSRRELCNFLHEAIRGVDGYEK